MSGRPAWVTHLWHFINDDIVDEAYGYPMDGSDDSVLEEIETTVSALLCRHYGHEIIDDQCMIPEHRYCVFCGRSALSIGQDNPPSPVVRDESTPCGTCGAGPGLPIPADDLADHLKNLAGRTGTEGS